MGREFFGKETYRNRFFSAALSFLGVLCLPQMLNLKGDTLAVSNSWFCVPVWGACWFFLDRAVKRLAREGRERRKRLFWTAGVFAFLFSLCIAFGVCLDREENVDFLNGAMWLAFVAWGVIFTCLVSAAWLYLEGRADNGQRQGAEEEEAGGNGVSPKAPGMIPAFSGIKPEALGKKRAVLLAVLFLLCWMPVFLAVYPGFFVYDAQDELVQMQTRNFTTHHPLAHVALLGGIVLAGNKLAGSYNAGIAAYTLFQMFFMAGVFTYTVSYMKRRGVRPWLLALTVLYFAFFPVIVMFTLCSAKDGIFTGALLLLVISTAEMGREQERFFAGWKQPLLFGGSALVMMSFRHNGMYAFAVMIPVLLLYMKGCRKKTAVLAGSVLAAYFLVTAGLTGLLSASDAENQEMLTVPIQQLARTWKYEKQDLSEEELGTLYEILPEEILPYYTAKVSDGVKIWFDNEAFVADPAKYGKLWLQIGLRHPFTYLNAWLMTSYGFWYPDTVIDVYRGNGVFTFTYGDSSFFGYEVEQPGVRESKLPWLDEWYRRMSLEVAQQRIPVISMLFSPGFLFWVFSFTGGYAFYRKRYGLALPFLLILSVWLTVILGPTYLPRYVLILWFALPGAAAVLAGR